MIIAQDQKIGITMSNVYFIGDTHWGHRNILKYRPEFSSIEEHDEIITQNILSTVDKRDTLWLLGDIIFDKSHIDRLRLISDHVGHLNWILGNHDSDNKARQDIIREILSMDIIHKVGSLFSNNGFWLSHPPIHPDELRSKPNIHGHVHSQTIPDNRYFNVSCENLGYTPINLNHIKEIINEPK